MRSLPPEASRLAQDRHGLAAWKRWGPYVSLRQWGTVREDYSADGDAWAAFTHDHARSRAYRWGEDGLAAICDRWQHLCVGVALWNGRDPFLKERLFGLTNAEGNHGEDVKEHWWPLDSTPTHSYMRWLYRYPHARFPYEDLRAVNAARGRDEPEYELVDTGVLDGGRFFDVEVTYAKATPDDLCIQISCTNAGPEAAELHLLPSAWLRNTWAWGRDDRRPELWAADDLTVAIRHSTLGEFWLSCDDAVARPELLFTGNETNRRRLFGEPNRAPFVKDGINDHVVDGAPTVDPARRGTKAAAWYRLRIGAGETTTISLRLADEPPAGDAFGTAFERTLRARRREADEFHAALLPGDCPAERAAVHRRAVAGLLWTKQHYAFHVAQWLDGDPADPPPPPGRAQIRNGDWRHLGNTDIISMPDAWEYPWYASWDLAFHMLPMAQVDPTFAKEQLVLLCREWYMHPNGQLPAYEWAFDDVNPPVHAWAALRVFAMDARATGVPDHDFLERVFHKLLMNFTWWVNRKDLEGRNVFAGGFLGLDNIGLFDRSRPLPGGGRLEQADGTSWMAMYALNMLAIALELAGHDQTYEDVATKFFEHFLGIAHALNTLDLWDDADGFFYDVLQTPGREPVRLKVRSAVGLIPLFAVQTIDGELLRRLPDFADRMRWFFRHRPALCEHAFTFDHVAVDHVDPDLTQGRMMLSVLGPDRLRRVLGYLLDEDEFLAPNGIRSMSRHHAAAPVTIELDGVRHAVGYEPAESRTEMFGGNSNWRGPLWFPINYLLVESLQTYHRFLGDGWTVPYPTGSGQPSDLGTVAADVSRRLIDLFLPDAAGRRPINGGRDLFDHDPLWRDHVPFPEYFHGDTGAALGASHQTGWTALVAELIARSGQ
jgi:hypothetical protein